MGVPQGCILLGHGYNVINTVSVLMLLLTWPVDHHAVSAETQEFCQNEAFQASCGPGEVVVISQAVYGRMEFSRCIERDYGYVGQCQEDVMRLADDMCSGKRECEIAIPNTQFDDLRPCPKDLKAYLQIAYTCINVVSADNQACISAEPIRLTEPSGVIASILTEERQLGSTLCPWLIQAQPGQRINVTLVDFAASTGNGDICHAYAIVREYNPTATSTVCSGSARERNIYTSKTHALEIRILVNRQGKNRNFLIKYDVLGCGDPLVPKGGFVERNGNTVTVGCADREHYWRLTCVGTTWRGQRGNCSGGVSIVVIVCIALALGLCILLFGLGILKWQRRQGARKVPTQQNENSYQSTKYETRPSAMRSSFDQDSMYATENEYAYISDIPPPPPPVMKNGQWSDKRPSVTYKADHGYGGYNHVRSPNVRTGVPQGGQWMPRNDNMPHGEHEDPPKYFELEHAIARLNNAGGYCPSLNGHVPHDPCDPPTPYENGSPEFPHAMESFNEFRPSNNYDHFGSDSHDHRNNKSV